MLKFIAGASLILSAFTVSSAAQADDLRVGLMAQDIKISGIGGVKGKEEGVAISLDYVFESPEFLSWALDPRPFIGGSLNLSGDTSYGGGGVLWQTSQTDKLFGELAFGVVAHNGTLEIPTPGEATSVEQAIEFTNRNASEIEFGSRILFRTQFAVGYRVNDIWSAELVYEHLSHGKILSNGSNEGLDSAGFRVGRKF